MSSTLTLTKDQKLAIDKFLNLKVGALFMKQGTGKTRVAIELINSTDTDFVLFVCPFSTKANLQAELNKWNFSKNYKIVGYETISMSDVKYLKLLDELKEHKKPFVVADESVFIKNDDSKIHNRMIMIRDLSEYRLILNGTPITKNELDIYNQMEFLSDKIFNMHRSEFQSTFFKKIRFKKAGQPEREFYKLSEVNIDYLHKLINPYIFESDFIFTKSEKEKRIMVFASDDTQEMYESQKESLLKLLEYGDASVEHFINMAVTCFKDKKRHAEIAKHLKGQQIVFCSLISEVENIAKLVDCYVITGSVPANERETILGKFKNDNKPLLITFGTGAFGLNLQFCNRIAFSSLTFDYAKIDQAISRIKRLGQDKDIEYTYFTSNLGIYDMINENVRRKITLKKLIIEKIEKGELNEKCL